MADPFALDPRLAAGSFPLGRLQLCEARLQNDRRWPWIVLVPLRPGLIEVEDLPPPDRMLLFHEALAMGPVVRAVGEALGATVGKLNLGALGNVVSQLHVHVVGRSPSDPAWPGPVWGFGAPEPYPPDALECALNAARPNFSATG